MPVVVEWILIGILVVVLASLIGKIVRWLKLKQWHLIVLEVVGFILLLIGVQVAGVVLLGFASGGLFYMIFLGGAQKVQSMQGKEAKTQTQKEIQILEFIDQHPDRSLSDIEQELTRQLVIHPQVLSDMLKSMEEDSLIEAEGKFGSLPVDKEIRLRITQAGIEFLMSSRG